ERFKSDRGAASARGCEGHLIRHGACVRRAAPPSPCAGKATGRNSRQNDSLTMRVAEDEDVWFHVKSSQGSHVILFTGGNAPSERDIFEAAVIAATNSGSKNSSKVEIDYTERKNVWKANGAKPGMVLYRKYHTIIVDPDTALCDRLRYTEI
ncbi:MAG: DUF814 domain-containing protein, partial [Clostridia bacterium]|nr:DUF814 domain-containing protein [Clostridia bacterium]